MLTAPRAAGLAAALLLLAVATDQRAPLGRVTGGPAAAAPRATAAVAPFTLFGWVSPPVPLTTPERYAEMAGAGLDLSVLAPDDSGRVADNQARLAAAGPAGVRCLLWDRRLYGANPATAGGRALLDSVVASYRQNPAFFGYYLGDEPSQADWDRLQPVFDALRVRDSLHPAWNNLLGRGAFATREAWESYTRGYLDRFHPAVLCNDQYDFRVSGDAGLFVENAAGLNAWSREYGIPFWAIVLLVQHGSYRALTEGELRWQVAMLLAYGARGVGYFTYWTPPPDPLWNWGLAAISYDGTRGPWYDVLAALNPRVRAVGERLATLTWLATTHAGSVPPGGTAFAPDGWVSAVQGRAALGHFADDGGVRYLLVVNSDSSAARTLELTLAASPRAWRLRGAGGEWDELSGTPVGGTLRLALDLEPGDFSLLRLDGVLAGSGGGGRGPRLTLAPNPAPGLVRLGGYGLAARARIEILDGAGRRVMARAFPAGGVSIEWRGERDGGGTVPPGMYFVRLEDARGVTAARLVWLGKR